MSSNEAKEKISLENFNYEAKNQRLNSPYSIRACRLKEAKEKDLYQLTLENISIFSLNQETCLKNYNKRDMIIMNKIERI